ncbi:MAG: hypothetical protein JWQ72_1935 [Polaromonas sp.]|nr:hypothetical protein [Polaromonas sp.]
MPGYLPLQMALAIFLLLTVVLFICGWLARSAGKRAEFTHEAAWSFELARVLHTVAVAMALFASFAAHLLWGAA